MVSIDPTSGNVLDARIEQSIGDPMLDQSAISAFRRWRFKPGTPARIRIPVTFNLSGATY
jgi:TonB family protein